MLASSDNWKDVQKYFQGCLVKFPQTGELLCSVDEVNPDRIRGKVWHPNEDGVWGTKVYQQPLHKPFELEYVMPRKSYFNYQGKAYFLFRIPARQYRKGICNENTSVVTLRGTGTFAACGVQDFDLMNAYVGKQAFMPFGVHKDVLSYAVSPRMAVAGKDNSLFLDRVKIGYINFRKNLITVTHDFFVSEVEKVVKHLGQKFTVKVGPLPAPKKSPIVKSEHYSIMDDVEVAPPSPTWQAPIPGTIAGGGFTASPGVPTKINNAMAMFAIDTLS